MCPLAAGELCADAAVIETSPLDHISVSDIVTDMTIKSDGETSGYASDEVFHSAMETCDLIMMDWKVSDPGLHKHYTGVAQDTILCHARLLAEGRTPFILRMPIIPGVNDNVRHFERVAELVGTAPALVRIDVLPYQRTAGAKYEMVNKRYCPDFDENIELCYYTEVFDRFGIKYQVFR